MGTLKLTKNEQGEIITAAIDDNLVPGFTSVTSTLSRGKMDTVIKAEFDEVIIEQYVPGPTPAPELSATFAAGSVEDSTKATISTIDERGNRFAYKVSDEEVATPNVGEIVADTTVYNSGDNITNVEADKYVALYELTRANEVVHFLCHKLTASEVKTA